MPLELLHDSRTAEEFMYTWPDTPQLLTLPADGRALTRMISANTIIDSGGFPPSDVNVVKCQRRLKLTSCVILVWRQCG